MAELQELDKLDRMDRVDKMEKMEEGEQPTGDGAADKAGEAIEDGIAKCRESSCSETELAQEIRKRTSNAGFSREKKAVALQKKSVFRQRVERVHHRAVFYVYRVFYGPDYRLLSIFFGLLHAVAMLCLLVELIKDKKRELMAWMLVLILINVGAMALVFLRSVHSLWFSHLCYFGHLFVYVLRYSFYLERFRTDLFGSSLKSWMYVSAALDLAVIPFFLFYYWKFNRNLWRGMRLFLDQSE